MTHEDKELSISELYLDELNPRFEPSSNQRDAIGKLLKDQGEKIVILAEDIFINGLNPSVRLIVFEEKGKFIDGDGNRRLTAMKILETPELAASEGKICQRIKQILKRNGTIPSLIPCVVFKNRKSANRWIEINHDGEQGGKGQIKWTAEQKDRFRGKPSIGLAALDLLSRQNLINQADRERINKSTLDRLLSFSNTKSELEIQSGDGDFKFGNNTKLKKAVLGLRDQKVDRVYTAEKGENYLSEVLSGEPESNPASNLKALSAATSKTQARSRRIKNQTLQPFGGPRSFKTGNLNNLYRDIEALYLHYDKNQNQYTEAFIVIFRMALRLLVETAAKDTGVGLQDFVKDRFDAAKKNLDKNEKTLLSNQNIKKETIVQLLQTGAHQYSNSSNQEQALALSLIVGEILSESHGK